MPFFPLLRASAFGILLTTLSSAQSVPLTVNPASREEVRQFYRAIYNASENIPIGWTGSYATGNAGDTSPAFKEATRLRINFFRALVGLPAGITFNPVFNAADQQAALMQSVNAFSNNVITLNHTPPASWTFFTAAGADASAKSNLYYGKAGADAITGYIADAGAINAALGHRRWMLFPQTLQMGTGDVPGDGTIARSATNATWILDTTPGGTTTSPRPATRTPQVMYPPAGFVPFQLVWPRWSFSYAGADFSGATVTMTRAGQSVPVALEPLSNTTVVGENTIVWVYNNTDSGSEDPHPRPAADTAYVVSVNNVRIGGASQNFTYTVTVFDPDAPAADFVPTLLAGSATPAPGVATDYAVTRPAFTNGFDWRTLQFSPSAKVYTAEAGLDGLTATTTAGYDVVQTITAGAGRSSYRLAHAQPASTQLLTLPGLYFVGSNSPTLTFLSQVGVVSINEVAHVQISTDDGDSWVDVFTQAGKSTAANANAITEENFVARTISLAPFAGRTISVRLSFTLDPTGRLYVPGVNNLVGWFVDNLTLTDVQTATPGPFTRVPNSSNLAFTPPAAGAIALQARGVMFGAYPIEWGRVLSVTARDPNLNNDPGRLVNMSIRTNAGTGDNTLIVGVGLGGGGTSGNKAVLLRAVGPTLTAFGVGGALADTIMTVFQGSAQIAQNDDWDAIAGATFGSVGAFGFAAASKDSALYNPALPSGSYSIQIVGKNNGTGVALAEVYDATAKEAFSTATPRLVNVSARTQVGTGDNILIAGFVVGGSNPVRVLVRAVGPTLGAFGVTGTLADPSLEILNSSAVKVAENDNWSGTSELKTAFASVAAFALTADTSRDAALVATLAPGSYTAQIRGVNNTSGVALVEVYELPQP
jgi:hypothetical protein